MTNKLYTLKGVYGVTIKPYGVNIKPCRVTIKYKKKDCKLKQFCKLINRYLVILFKLIKN